MSETLTTVNLAGEIINTFRQAGYASGKETREKSIQLLEQSGLPGNKHEEYRFTPITRHLEKHFNASQFFTIAPDTLQQTNAFLIPEYEGNLIVFVNGCYSERFSKIISPKEQLQVQSLEGALGERSDWLTSHFSNLALPGGDPFTALNTALWQSGVFISVPDNTVLEKPIVIHHLHDAQKGPVVSITRLMMELGRSSEAMIVEKFDSTGAHPVFSSFVDEIFVKENGTLNYCKIQNDEGSACQVANTAIHQEASSRVNTYTISLNGQLIRNNFSIAIDGEKCESHFYGLYLLDHQTLVDNHTVVDHRKPNSFSNQLYKGVMDANSKGVFNGKIYVRPQAQKTNAFQSNRNILLTDTSTINTKPQLEIWADDVKCSHGCTSGQLDDEALFYLQSRGISKTSAQALLLYAFAGEVLATMQDLQLKSFLDTLISERLNKKLK